MKTKALISFGVTVKLICVFVFAYAKSRFSHDAARIKISLPISSLLLGPVTTQPCQKFRRQIFLPLDTKMSHIMRKPGFLHMQKRRRSSSEHLCFRYIVSIIPLLSKSLAIFCGCRQPGLCWTWSKTPKADFLAAGFLETRLKL